MLGKIEGRRGGQLRLDSITDSMDMSLSKFQIGEGQGSLACFWHASWGLKELDTT